MFLKPTCTNGGDHPSALFLVRNRRYVTNLIPTHVQTRAVFHPLFLLLSSPSVPQPSRTVSAEFNEFHAIGRASTTPPV